MRNTHKLNQLTLFTALVSLCFLMYCSSNSDSDSDSKNSSPKAENNTLEVLQDSNSGEANQIDVSVNDFIGTDGGDNDNYSLSKAAANGKVSEIEDGIFEYIPNSVFFGSDAFTYKLTDANNDMGEAEVFVTVIEGDGPTLEDFENIDPDYPSFVSIENATPEGYSWVKMESMSD
ncbi:hypothetical protein F6U93_06185 [Tamlana haliotis]|uniref:Cadherin-like domain-containing protein n=1 Tax=Pseudotamlana haliotis TaxID=2614804 RepID=A0A6N6MFM1_9FLAO|nr:Ig-like domain-containing protein [Tamlana haliotis]KAB1068593.1 hypothetical protein F6U93_06185 [Tamlana haliotis]